LYDLATRLRIVEFIDRHVSKRGGGPTVGTYLLVAAINRCVAPCSKASIADWFGSTTLRRLVDIETRQLTSQRFWDNMDRVSTEAIIAIERDLVAHMVREFDIDLQRVLFDATNFFTFIDTFNERSTLAQRGKSKEGRAALRIVGLALLVSADFPVPLMHRTYPGNQPDAPTFSSLIEEIVARYRLVTDGAEPSRSSSTRGTTPRTISMPSTGAPTTSLAHWFRRSIRISWQCHRRTSRRSKKTGCPGCSRIARPRWSSG
jgi:transposase